MLVETCCKMGMAVSVENPAASVMWHHPKWLRLARKFDVQFTDLDYCQYGMGYRKRTRLATYMPGQSTSFLGGLARRCPGVSSTHQHTWVLSGWYPLRHMDHPMLVTKKGSATYPQELVEAWARLVVEALIR